MAGQKALGRLFNTTPAADGVWINLKAAGGVAFLCYLGGAAGDTYTLQEAKDSAGTGAQNLVNLTEYWTNVGNGTTAWARTAQAASATIVTTATAAQQAMVCEVESTSLSDTYKFVKLTSTGAGTVNAVTRDLAAMRTPANLPATGV
jgi:deoxyribose-phosphate aldolase